MNSRVDGMVKKCLNNTKGSGARKLNKQLIKQHCGKRIKIQRILDSSKHYLHHKATFENKPIPRPIRAKEVQDQHQIDLTDIGKWKIRYGHFIFSTAVDVFRR